MMRRGVIGVLVLGNLLVSPVNAQTEGSDGIGVGVGFDVEQIMPQRFRDPGARRRAVFPVKYVCGETRPTDRLAPGSYRTVINVLNLSTFQTQVGWIFSPGLGRAGFEGASALIPRFGSFSMDCPFIIQNLQAKNLEVGPFTEGFITIVDLNNADTERTPTRVTALYSALPKQVHNQPDLLPIRLGPTWCRLDDQKRLIITIRNQGEANAPASTTRIAINGSSFNLVTPALAPGTQADLAPVPLPSGEGTFTFTITADIPDVIREMSETNNSAIGSCMQLN
jgi:CARDB